MPPPTSARRQLARFLGVGLINTAVAFVVFREVLAALPRVPGAPAAAQGSAWVVSMLCSYLLNRRLTFRSAAARGPEFARFVASQLAYLAVSTTLLEAGISGLHLPATPTWVATIGFMTVLNYLGQRYWVFRGHLQ
jgi:putative flippase GtrA